MSVEEKSGGNWQRTNVKDNVKKNQPAYRGNRGGSVGSVFDFGPMCCRFESHPWN